MMTAGLGLLNVRDNGNHKHDTAPGLLGSLGPSSG